LDGGWEGGRWSRIGNRICPRGVGKIDGGYGRGAIEAGGEIFRGRVRLKRKREWQQKGKPGLTEWGGRGKDSEHQAQHQSEFGHYTTKDSFLKGKAGVCARGGEGNGIREAAANQDDGEGKLNPSPSCVKGREGA